MGSPGLGTVTPILMILTAPIRFDYHDDHYGGDDDNDVDGLTGPWFFDDEGDNNDDDDTGERDTP